jgi:hypothetical protein
VPSGLAGPVEPPAVTAYRCRVPPQPDPQSTPDASASPHAPQTDARRVRRWMRAIVPYAVAATASLIAAVVLLRLWDANLRVPLDYGGDALFFQMTVKAIAE